MQLQVNDTIFSNWKIKRVIGEGSFGVVYEIERVEGNHVYQAAAKVISIPHNSSDYMDALDEGMSQENITEYYLGMVEDVINECVILEKMKGDSHIVSYEDHLVTEDENRVGWNICIRMELLTPLAMHIKGNPFRETDVVQLGIDICHGLETCQKFNIIHRDIKPENIFVSNTMNYKLGDFGISRTMEKSELAISKKGTQIYMAPEVYLGKEYDSSVDIYSLGLVLYRLMNDNRIPFLPPMPQPIRYSDREVALKKRINGESIPAPAHACKSFSEVILNACRYNPKERYNSPKDMRRALERVLDQLESGLYKDEDTLRPFPSGENEETGGTVGGNQFFGKIEILEEQKKRELEKLRRAEEAKRLEEEEKQKTEEEERRIEEEEKRKAEEEARRKAEEEEKRKAEEEARRKAEEEEKRRAEEEARRIAEEEEKRKAEEEARRKAEEEEKRKAEEEARRKAEEEEKRKAEEEARRKAEEEEKRKAEEEARRKAEEEARRKAEDARRKAEEETRKKAEEEAKQKAAEEEKRRTEERRITENAKRKVEERARKIEEEEREIQEIAKRKAEEAKKKAIEEAKKKEQTDSIKLKPRMEIYPELLELDPIVDTSLKVGNTQNNKKSGESPKSAQSVKSVQHTPKRKKSKFTFYVTGALILVCGIGAASILLFTSVPDVTGMSVENAVEKLQDSDLSMGTTEYEFSYDVPENTVISQNKTQNIVKKNETIDLVISKGVAVMPDLSNMGQEEAQNSLNGMGLDLVLDVQLLYSTTVENGLVCGFAPETNTVLKKGDTVVLYVSQGVGTMPNVVGMSVEEATNALGVFGVNLVTSEAYNAAIPAGQVAVQSIGEGEAIGYGTEVSLEISLGVELLTVPAVTGFAEADARAAFTNAGFSEEELQISYEYSDSVASGVVISQDVAENSQVEKGSVVKLSVSQGSQPVTTNNSSTRNSSSKKSSSSKSSKKSSSSGWNWEELD